MSAIIEARPIRPIREGRRRWTTTAAAALIGLAALVAGLVVAAPANAALPAPKEQIIQRILDETNTIRASVGAAPLVLNPAINVVAENWSRQQAAAGVMSHNPNYASQIPGGWRSAGENVAYGYRYTDVTTAWKNSPGHYKNMVGDYTDIGIGVAEAADGSLYYTQNFAKYPATVVYPVGDALKDFWNSRGGAAGQIGNPIAAAVQISQNGGGWYQRFYGGNVYSSAAGAVFVANNVILSEYNRLGGPAGSLNWPNGEQSCVPGGLCAQSFAGGVITTTPSWGAHALIGGFRDYWQSQGGLSGKLGSAVNDMTYSATNAGTAWQQNFTSGVLVQSSVGGFQLIPYSPILTAWSNGGGGSTWVGWPTGAYECGSGGCAQAFSGAVLASSYYGVNSIIGGFIQEWRARGGVNGELGVPFGSLSMSTTPSTGWSQNYANGILTQTSSGFLLIPYGAGQATWSNAGGSAGYGWPTSARSCGQLGCTQSFTNAVISDTDWGGYATYGGILDVWKKQGGASKIGAAVGTIRFTNVFGGGWAQHYTTGVITQSSGGSYFTPYSPILNMWYHYGAETTWLGWPAGEQKCDSSGACVQKFQNGVARSNSSGGVSFDQR